MYKMPIPQGARPLLAAKPRPRLYPSFFRMGPIPLSIASVLLIGLMAVLYLNQFAQAVAANQKLQDIHAQQAALQRQNQDLVEMIAQEQSPSYIVDHAKSMGLVPADPKTVQVIPVPRLQPIVNNHQSIEP